MHYIKEIKNIDIKCKEISLSHRDKDDAIKCTRKIYKYIAKN